MNRNLNRNLPPIRLVPLACLLLLVPAGCTNHSDIARRRDRVDAETVQSTDNLGLAMQFLNLSDELEPERARAQCAYHLNRWLETQQAAPGWVAAPLLARVPSDIRGQTTPESLERLRFTLEDVRYLQQAQWMRDVSQWVTRMPASGPMDQWLANRPEELSEADAEQLVAAERLLDWTIRNIQLDPLAEYPAGSAAGPTADAQGASGSALPAPARGEPGPGYTYYPWQVMLYGRGDAWQRARVFIQLCRQRQIDAVMLAIDEPTRRPTPFPWIPAVLLGGELYLFDTQLGLPIPGPDGRPVATLAQVRIQPTLLESLDVGTRYKYPVRGEQLDKLVALVDASPFALSQRMYLVEQNLAGEDKLTLTVDPDRMVRELADVAGIRATQLWQLPFEVELFRAMLPEVIQQSPELARQFFRKELMYEGSHPLVAGRRRAFRGQFEPTDDAPGAKALYLEARLPDSVINNLATDREARQRVGLEGALPDNPAARATLLTNTEILLREGKLAASLWLGIAQYETGQFADALEWLDERTLQADPEGRWSGAAHYNLGRTHEALGNYDKARDLYYADQSPQAHGNRLRARYFPQPPAESEGAADIQRQANSRPASRS